MDPKLLTEDRWKAVAQKYKVKDKDLQRALLVYETLDDEEYDDRLKELANLNRLASNLKKSREIAAQPEVVKYLADLVNTLQVVFRDVTKAKATTEKMEATARKNDAAAKEVEEDEDSEDEEEASDYPKRLLQAFAKLKGAKDLSFQFLVCDAKPHPIVMVAKRITPQHKEEITGMVEGSKRFLKVGTCAFQAGKYNFVMDEPMSGLARRLQASIKNYTGKKLPIVVGDESVLEEDAEETATKTANTAGAAAAKLPRPELAKAPQVWRGTRDILEKNLTALRQAIKTKYGSEDPGFREEIDKNIEKLDVIIEKLDDRLADSLAKAYASKDDLERNSELKNSKAILAQYINYVRSEPLIAHIDANPFGVKTNLKAVITGSLTHLAQAIG
jgi:hypothetical protein